MRRRPCTEGIAVAGDETFIDGVYTAPTAALAFRFWGRVRLSQRVQTQSLLDAHPSIDIARP